MSDSAFQPLHITPSDEQRAIQLRRTRLLLVEANAGAAKTTTLALRMAQALHRGAPPDSLLALTSTVPAVHALKERLAFIGVPAGTLARLRVASFEDFSDAVLATAEGGRPTRLTTPEQVRPYVVRAVERALSWPDERHPDDLNTDARPSDLVEGLLQSFERLKGQMALQQLEPETALTPALAADLGLDYLSLRTWQSYEFIRKGGHPDHPEFRLDGDATFDLARQLLSGDIEPSDTALPHGLSLICVDEMHDVNRAAFTVLKALLAANPRAAFVGVGDRDQVIHAERGAEAAFMGEHFRAEVGTPETLPLTHSRRFSPALAQHVGALARKAYAADAGVHTDIHLERCESARLTAEYVARLAQTHLAQPGSASLRVLLRHPAQSVRLEQALLRLGVPYETAGFASYLDRPETLLMRGLYAHAQHDYTGFDTAEQRARLLDAWLRFSGARIDSTELRHLDATQAQHAAVAEAAHHVDSTHSFVEGHALRSAQPVPRRCLEAALAVLRTGDMTAFEASFLKALDPATLAARMCVRREDAQQVVDHLTQLHRVATEDAPSLTAAFCVFSDMDAARRRSRHGHRVVLSSIEAAKGLEFDHVVVPHLSAGEFGNGTQDNRNLLYVALTRAKHQLTLTFDPARPSRFLKDAGWEV